MTMATTESTPGVEAVPAEPARRPPDDRGGMTIGRRLALLAAGLLAGVVASLAMVLAMAAGRTWLGISPPPEAIPDRFAPTLDIDTFFSLFGRFGGYNGLKRFGITSGLTGLFAVGALVGLAYVAVSESVRSRRAPGWRRGISPLGLRFVAAAALVLWVATLVVLWPVLDANYRGLPPSTARLVSALALLAYYALYGVVLIAAYRFLTRRPALAPAPATAAAAARVSPPAGDAATPPPFGQPLPRRAIVTTAAGAALAVPAVALIQRLNERATFAYDGRPYSGPDIQPITPSDRFYSVTKNVVDPNVARPVWGLEVGGLVEAPRTYGFGDIAALPAVEQESTLMCISNRIGSGLFSNAVWTGVPLRDLLDAARPGADSVEVLLHAADGYTDTFSIEQAMDPTTLVAFMMNGEPLPERHGYPARIVVPGLYGEKNVKWVTGIEVVDHDAKGFYEQQGWGPSFEVPTRSDIFAPRWSRSGVGDAFAEPFRVGREATIRGRAFAGARGVSRVEFSADDGATWADARIDYPGTDLTWVFWSFPWRPTEAGEAVLLSRATDGTGTPQIGEQRGIVPQGATGYHRVVATVAG